MKQFPIARIDDGRPARASRVDAAVRSVAVLLGLALVAAGCTAPIGVEVQDPRTVHAQLVKSALSGDEPSSFTTAVLQRSALARGFADDPALTLERMRRDIFWAEASDRLFALAELSFLHADRTDDRKHYLAAAVYAYAFMFPDDPGQTPPNLDPRLRIAADLYNRGLTRGLGDPESGSVAVHAGVHELPFGEIEIEVDEADFRWGGYELIDFYASADLLVHGLRNRYRHPGIGAPLAARTHLADDARTPATPIPNTVRVPVTILLRIATPRAGIVSGKLRGRVDVFGAHSDEWVDVAGRRVPLEFETTAALASTLTLSRFWESETAGFFGTLGVRPPDQFGKGLFMLHPYTPGRIPLVLVHGTASSPGRWAELVNEVMGVGILRDHYQIWLFTYDTGQPVSFSAGLLREALRNAVEELDPDGDDAMLRNMVVMGHSQGGLLTKLTSVSSGDAFWTYPVPFDELELDERQEHVLRRSLFFEPLPFVQRVVFVATPHGGSFLTLWSVAGFVGDLVTMPVWVAQTMAEVVAQNPDLAEHDSMRRIPTAIDNMTPSNPFLMKLRALPIAPHVAAHSIIAVKGDGPPEEGNDGVVEYTSAHLEGVRSEHVVRSGHSVQSHPGLILEVGRILLEHLLESGLEEEPDSPFAIDVVQGDAPRVRAPVLTRAGTDYPVSDTVKRLVLILLVVAVLGVAYLLFSLDARVARAIEESVSSSLGAEATVEGVDLVLAEGRGTIRGLAVANPEGFSDADLFRFEEIDLAIEPASVGRQPLRVTEARIGASTVRFEVTGSGDSNIEHIVHHLSKHAPEDDEAEGAGEPQRVAIEALRFDGGEVIVRREGKDEPETVRLPPLEMADVGGDDGATGGALSREIARALTRRVVAATAGHELGRAVGKELGDTAGEVAESILRDILD